MIQRQPGKGRSNLLDRYSDQMGRLVERQMSTAALVAAKQEAERMARQAHRAMLEARASEQALRAEIDQRMQAQSRLAYLANHDPLTGLANRTLMGDQLARMMERARQAAMRAESGGSESGEAAKGAKLALLCLDLDRFKDVNDTLGHEAGDLLLREVARRLESCVRPGSIVARMGGDEFAILLPDLADPQEARDVAARIIACMAHPVDLPDKRVFTSGSVGITIYPTDGDRADLLLRNADLALYRAKHEGRNGYYFFDSQLNEEVRRRTSLEQGLHEALAKRQLFLVYQPQIDLATDRLTGSEALLRWRHPEHGLVGPTEFIPVAERSGLINAIGAWVLEESCRQLVRWDQQGLPPMRVAVNVAITQFKSGDVPRLVANILQQTGVAPARLEIEITESGVMHDIRDAVQILTALHNLGVGLAIDDFGTGYSSLSYLRRLPVGKIKVDRSFVTDITHNEDAAAVARTIVTLGHNLRLKVVAEGVETEAHARYVKLIRCDYGQGYYYGRPLPPDDLAAMARNRSAGRDWPAGDAAPRAAAPPPVAAPSAAPPLAPIASVPAQTLVNAHAE